MKYLITSLIVIFSFIHEANADLNIFENLNIRNELFIATQKVRPLLYDEDVLRRLDAWVTNEANEGYVVPCQFHLRPIFQSSKIIAPLCYFLRQDDPGVRGRYYDFVNLFILQQKAVVFELMRDPRYDENLQKKALKYYDLFTNIDENKLRQCFKVAMRTDYTGGISSVPFSGIATCLINNLKDPYASSLTFIGLNPQKVFGNHPGHPVSAAGWISGNKVTYLHHNDVSEELTEILESTFNLVQGLYPLNGRGSFQNMLKEDSQNIFTAEEGFEPIKTHPVWGQGSSIFSELIDGFNSAKESIFIDIFFLGGTMGGSLAKHLVRLLEQKPNLKILILRDLDNHFGHEEEMLPVFNFLKAYSYLHPDRLMISKSHIMSHLSGLPDIFREVVTDEFLKLSGLQEHLDLYGKAVSDHSKVVVIDGKSSSPVALVGSKNWTDSSGGNCYDEVVKIEGPAAAVVLDDYYFDMFFALENEFYKDGEKNDSYLDHYLKNGWAKIENLKNLSRKQKVSAILQPFDLLNRDENLKSQLKHNPKVNVTEQGTTLLRTGYNNVDSTDNNALAQVIQLILNAKEKILIKDQYLFDRNVVFALLKAKQKNPDLDIRIILDPLERASIKGMPNLLYLDILRDAGIRVRFKKVLPPGGNIAQEYHMKTISADGKFVISGSANKDQTTMYGSFREEQVDIFDEEATAVHDRVFEDHWENGSYDDFQKFNFKVPFNLKGLDGKELSQEEFIALLRDVISIMFDAKMY